MPAPRIFKALPRLLGRAFVVQTPSSTHVSVNSATLRDIRRTKRRIVSELDHLRKWRTIANPEQVRIETEVAHNRINSLLDLLEDQTQSYESSKQTPPP